MPTSEKFCLRWNDFQDNVNNAFRELRKDREFTDVTLACEDGHQVDAHKVILSASSPFFQNLLKRNKHAHPLIYMRGMKSEDLLAIIDFLYYGEVDIYQENLDVFLNIAEELQLKGLNGTESGGGNADGEDQNYNPTVPNTAMLKTKQISQINILSSQTNHDDQITSSTAVALPKYELSGDMKELDEKIESLMYQGENMIKCTNQMKRAYVCQVCGKEGLKHVIRDHIEANHLDGISVPCSICEKTSRSRNSLRTHTYRCNIPKN